ncbi:MAG: hypothetical protein R3F62_23410 [Planctomycetota bacterium]
MLRVACLLLLLTTSALRADVAPDPGRKWNSTEYVFQGLDACPEWRFVLLECSGPGEPSGVLIEEGVAVPPLNSKGWFRPVLVALQEAPDPGALGELAQRVDELPRATDLDSGPGEISAWSAVTRTRVTYRVLGVAPPGIELRREASVGLDAEGRPAEYEPTSPVLLGVLGAVGLALLGSTVALLRRRRSGSE